MAEARFSVTVCLTRHAKLPEVTDNPTFQAHQSSFRLPVTNPIGTDVNKPVRLSTGVVVGLSDYRQLGSYQLRCSIPEMFTEW